MTAPLPSRPRRPLAALLALLAVAVVLTGLGIARPAAAHGGDAVVTVEQAHASGQSIHYVVRVTWEDDGHPATDATVTATAVDADGRQVTPVALAPADADGRYAGTLEYPAAGPWTLRITSVEPTGALEQRQEVTVPSTTASPDVTTGDEGADGFAPADDGTGASAVRGDGAAATDGDDGDSSVAVIAVAAVVAVLGAVTAVALVRRVRARAPGGGPASGEGPSAATVGEDPSGRGSGDPTASGTEASQGP
ncbi:MAG TPA: FixH family protein [Acidimicrobiales bacterium]|nr:FixH family protein [Acidimicrobiales bacterium]